jgi:tetratricopeptide (TPR) repeat protein
MESIVMKRAIYPIVFATLILLSSTAPGESSLTPADYLELREDAERAYRDRDAEAATALYLQLTEEFPGDSEMWFGLSRAYEWSGDLPKAISTAMHVQKLGYASRASLSYRLAQLNAMAGHPNEALRWIDQALAEGYEERPDIQSDEVFAALHDDPEFIRLAAIIPDNGLTRNDGLRFDIDYLVEEAQRMHGSHERQAFSAEFEFAAQNLEKTIPDISDAQFLTGIMQLLAILADGHTGIYGPDSDTPLDISGKMLPLKFYWFDEGVYIVDGIGPMAAYAGQQVLKFGDMSAREALEKLSAYRGLDNPMMWKWMGPQFYLVQLQMLQIIGATPSTEQIQLTLQDADGQVSTKSFDGGDRNMQRKLRPSPAAKGDVPMYLTNIDTEFWMQSLPEQGAVYFQFNQVRNSEEQSIADFAMELGRELAKERVTTLIIDVRHNNGGNNSLVRPLIKTMVGFEQASSENQIYVITGRNTFSAAQNFVNRIEQWTEAMFIGEPSSSRPNFVGEETNLLLPYSRIRGSISTRFWQDSDPGDDRIWITPKVPVPPTAEDYFNGRDAAMEAILELVTQARDR